MASVTVTKGGEPQHVAAQGTWETAARPPYRFQADLPREVLSYFADTVKPSGAGDHRFSFDGATYNLHLAETE